MQSTSATPQVFVNGRILKATNFDAEELFIKWELISGTNFKLIEGKIKGETFQGVSDLQESKIFFDHPLMFNLSCKSIKGWPKFLIEVWSTDQHNRNYLIGYGTAFLPFTPGNVTINVPCWRPMEQISPSWYETFLGNTPEFIDKSAVYSTDERFGMHTLSTGNVVIELDILMKDFNLHGIKFK
jgi:B9 domain-containing protein 2